MQNNIPNNPPGLEKLIRRITAAEKSQQKDIRISIQEAREIITELALLSANLSTRITEIHEALENIKKNSSEIEVKFDGGGF